MEKVVLITGIVIGAIIPALIMYAPAELVGGWLAAIIISVFVSLAVLVIIARTHGNEEETY